MIFPEEVARFREVAEHIKTEMEIERASSLFPVRFLSEMVIASLTDDSPITVNLRTLRETSR